MTNEDRATMLKLAEYQVGYRRETLRKAMEGMAEAFERAAAEARRYVERFDRVTDDLAAGNRMTSHVDVATWSVNAAMSVMTNLGVAQVMSEAGALAETLKTIELLKEE